MAVPPTPTIWLPPGASSVNPEIEQNPIDRDILSEAQRLANWMRKWPKKGEAPLGLKDLGDLVFAQARTHCWERERCEAIYTAAAKMLDLIKPPKETKKSRHLKAAHEHRWRDPEARFLTCVECGLVAEKPKDGEDDGNNLSRIGRSEPESRKALTDLPPEEKERR